MPALLPLTVKQLSPYVFDSNKIMIAPIKPVNDTLKKQT